MPKNILIFSEFFYPHWTGLSKSIYFLAKQLAEQGEHVSVMTTRHSSKLKKQECYENIQITRFPYAFALSRTLYSPQTIFRSIPAIAQHDTIIINSPHSNIFPLSVLSKILRKKLVIYHQGDLLLPKKTGSQAVHWIIERAFDIMTISSMFLADTVATYTRDYAERSRVMKYFLGKFQAIVPQIILNEKAPSEKCVKKMRELRKHPLVGCAGRFVEEKGFDILMAALPEVIRTCPDALFVFAGETNMGYEKFFEMSQKDIATLSKHLIFLGLLEGQDLSEFYRSLTVFVLSSRSDCFALTQAEAMMYGVPVVSTNIPGARMLVQETGFGEIAETENPPSLAQAIIKVIRHRDTYQKNRQNVFSFFKKYALTKELI